MFYQKHLGTTRVRCKHYVNFNAVFLYIVLGNKNGFTKTLLKTQRHILKVV